MNVSWLFVISGKGSKAVVIKLLPMWIALLQ